MKRTNKIQVVIQRSIRSSEPSMDCSCEILNDTSLSNVGDSDCQCSECLQANLNAFNQFKIEEANTLNTTKNNIKKNRGKHTLSATKNDKQAGTSINRYKSTQRIKTGNGKTRKKWGVPAENQEYFNQELRELGEGDQYTNGQLNDFLLITRHRTRKYLAQRKQLQQNQKQQKDNLKDKIKKNLELLKYTAQMMRDENQIKQQQMKHPYKWNHSKYNCQCNGKNNEKNHNCCRKIKVKQSLDTNLQKFKQNFSQNRNEILQEKKRKRQEERKQKQKEICPYDQCPNHHNRTDKNKIKEIQKFITKNVKKHKEKLKKAKQQKQQKQKAIEAKLRAIDIKSKQILGRSKKIDDNISRTSFKMSIDQFDTFSELRQENQKRKKIRENNRQVKKNLQMGGGQLQKRIYEQLEQEQEENQHYARAQNKILHRTTKGDAPAYRPEEEQIYDRIAYDAQIQAPKNLKGKPKPIEDNNKKTSKKPSSALSKAEKQTQRQKNLSKGKEQAKKKKLQKQIELKKKQILDEYKKRNSNQVKNKQVREQYQQKIKQSAVEKYQKKTKHQKSEKSDYHRDPYRTNYQTRAGKNSQQIKVHGDPLLQQYTYHQEKQKTKAPRGENMNIFTQNAYSLKSKTQLKV